MEHCLFGKYISLVHVIEYRALQCTVIRYWPMLTVVASSTAPACSAVIEYRPLLSGVIEYNFCL
jgi:hypothetical protein